MPSPRRSRWTRKTRRVPQWPRPRPGRICARRTASTSRPSTRRSGKASRAPTARCPHPSTGTALRPPWPPATTPTADPSHLTAGPGSPLPRDQPQDFFAAKFTGTSSPAGEAGRGGGLSSVQHLVVIYVPLDQPTGDLVHRFRPADPSGAGRWLDFVPDRLVRAPEKLTGDGLVIHLPDRGVALVGDMLMPQLGGPFFPEGSVEGLFESMTLVEGLAPRVVIHGHTPLTDLFTIDLFPVLAAALQD